MLNNPLYISYITWTDFANGVFKIINPEGLAQMWGKRKGHINMTYEKMARALRHYYRLNLLKKVSIRGCYQFTRLPTTTGQQFEHFNINPNPCEDPDPLE